MQTYNKADTRSKFFGYRLRMNVTDVNLELSVYNYSVCNGKGNIFNEQNGDISLYYLQLQREIQID